MNDYLSDLIAKYGQKGILIDTNILLLFLVGSLNPQLIPNFKRTSVYTVQDFQIVSKIIEFFEIKVTTPHILTEVSNLIGRRSEIQRALRGYIQIGYEIYFESTSLAANDTFLQFGLADSAIFEVSANDYLVLTDDGRLSGILSGRGVDVVSLALLRKVAF